MSERSLPDLKTRVRVDRKDLDALPGSAKKTGAAMKEHLGGSAKHADNLEKSLTKVGGALTHLGPAGAVAGSALQDITGAATSVGGALASAGGIAVGALAAIAGAAMYAEGAYEKLVARVDNFQDATNASGEDASRMVHVLDVLGVQTETAAAAMFKMSHAIAENPDKLGALGIEIKKTSDGGVDLIETLYSVADAYNNASDSSAKTSILFAAFGKSGRDMIDVVEQGSDRLRELAAATKLVLTDDDIARAREYKVQQGELKSGWDEWVASLGQKVQPALGAVQVSMLRGNNLHDRLNQLLKEGKITRQQWSDAMQGNTVAGRALAATIDKEYDASKKAQHAMALHTLTIKEQEEANKKLVDSMNNVIGGYESQHNSSFALARANLAVSESGLAIEQAHMRQTDAADNVRKAWDALVLASQTYGKNSLEAKYASDAFTKAQLDQRAVADDVTKAELDQEQAYYAAATAARKLQEDTDMATTGQKNATKETQVYIDKLQAEANALAPDSPLRKRLQDYIDKLRNEIPANVFTTLHIGMSLEGHPGKALDDVLPHYGGGGRPQVGVPAVFGEHGTEIWTPDQPGTVTPHGQTPPAGGGAGNHYTLTLVGTPVVNDPDGVQRMLQRMEAMGAAY